MKIIGVKEVMDLTGLGRPTVTKLLRDPECPTLPRHKNESYRVEINAFTKWFNYDYMKRRGG